MASCSVRIPQPALLRRRLCRLRLERRPWPQTGRRCQSSDAAADLLPTRPRIISLRALNHHLPRYPHLVRPPPPRGKKKVDDSSWPLPLQIAGYTALALSVPYSLGTVLAGSERLRDALEGDRPDLEEDRRWGKAIVAMVRAVWGTEEVRPYVDWLRGEELLARREWEKEPGSDGSSGGEAPPPSPKAFESESLAVRGAQVEVARACHSPVTARITLNPDGEMGGCVERDLPGDLPADAAILRSIVADAGVVSDGGAGEQIPVAVDFVDEETAVGDAGAEEDVAKEGEVEMDKENTAAETLRRMTYLFSAWHYDPSWETAAAAQSTSSSSASSRDSEASSSPKISSSTAANDQFAQLRLKELDARARQLASDLQDPNCIRDLDDVKEELREVRAEARKLRGWGGTVKGWFVGNG